MGLRPAERRVLDKIENSLRHSDPQLARMLGRFSVPLTRGGLMVMARRPRRLRLVIAAAVGLAAVIFLVVAALHGPAASR
jgi:hypothetical protein